MIGCLAQGGPGKAGFLQKKNRMATSLTNEQSLFFFGKGIHQKGPWKLLGDSAYEALYLARASLEVIYDAIPKFITLPWRDQLSLFEVAREWQPHSFVKYAKYFTVYPMARYLKNDLPSKPEGFSGHPLVFKGKARRILKNRLVSHTRDCDRLWFGILQGVKRGCAVVSDNFIADAYKKHAEQLARDPPVVEPEWYQRFETYVERMFDRVPFASPVPKLFEASNSASFESTRGDGGARSYIRDPLEQDQLIRMVETAPGRVQEMRGTPCPKWREVLDDCKPVYNTWMQNYLPNVMVSAVLEPLKVRLITKGPAHSMWLGRFYQKALWNYLQEFPCFRLTGKTMSIIDVLRLKEDSYAHHDMWVSGDYSAATDGLNIHCTKILFEAFLSRSWLEEEVKETLRSVLYEQNIHYPIDRNRFANTIEPYAPTFTQRNGQLMGSILSFPILCLVNMICYWMSVETSGPEVPEWFCPKTLPVLVNGDDILFKADNLLYKVWNDNIGKAGFELSLGKNYISRSYLTVNSQLFVDRQELEEVHFLNTGLLTGQSKLTGREEVKSMPIWDYFNYCVPNSKDKERSLKRFFHYNREWIEKLTHKGNYNCFLHPQRGGLGFEFIRPFGVTSFQRRLGTLIERRVNASLDEGKYPRLALGLVRESKQDGAPIFHDGRKLSLAVAIGPLSERQVEYEERQARSPPLCYPVVDCFLKFRPVRNLGELRSSPVPQMSNEDLDSWSRVVYCS